MALLDATWSSMSLFHFDELAILLGITGSYGIHSLAHLIESLLEHRRQHLCRRIFRLCKLVAGVSMICIALFYFAYYMHARQEYGVTSVGRVELILPASQKPSPFTSKWWASPTIFSLLIIPTHNHHAVPANELGFWLCPCVRSALWAGIFRL